MSNLQALQAFSAFLKLKIIFIKSKPPHGMCHEEALIPVLAHKNAAPAPYSYHQHYT